MLYTAKDFFHELAYNTTFIQTEQNFEFSHFHDFSLIDNNFICENHFFNIILSLNDIIRVEKNTIFKIHKGYPSPRSLYPIKVFMVMDDRTFLTKSGNTSNFEVYSSNSRKANRGDILIEYGKEYPAYYKSIKKSLFLLETGHLLFNILSITKAFGYQYEVQLNEKYILLKKVYSNKDQTINLKEISRFLEVSLLRNSGPYLHPITSFKQVEIEGDTSSNIIKHLFDYGLSNLFSQSLKPDFIDIIKLVNKGEGKFVSSNHNETIDYKHLNKVYPYINFKGVSGMYLFLLDNKIFEEEEIASQYIMILGFIAQYYCLLYASKENFCRPVKSFNVGETESLLRINGYKQTILYSLIVGTP
ncbi:hypothetical protein [Sutcliffiella rhizosphaerae]|uniref:Nitroreductase domain-containing protein n=1 Tax=Sutcliffiella rhizosphaerae TaxID=2880967 RepID=A0ABN8A7X7_9BACI|nr:hypothetical protein [Sutcliffiella rhizosphaerae]CAG9621195.1 hypothetical protein BACCIP111883_01967 [Sutcliffiella rhizosphaerae]